MRILSESEVRRLVDIDEMIAASGAAFRLLSDRQALVPPRTEFSLPEGAICFLMPGLVADRYLGFKLIMSKPAADPDAATSATSLIMIVDARTITPIGMFGADWFTDMRTGAGIAAASDLLARKDARTLTVFGAGKLAEPTIRCLCRVRAFSRLFIVGRQPLRVFELVETLRADAAFAGVAIEGDASPDEAAAAADVIATVTSSAVPVFDGRVVRPGTHVNIAGAYRPDHREIDDGLASRGLFYLDSEPACRERAGDIVLARASGALSDERIRGEIGAALAGKIPGRVTETEITVFKSLGNAVQDIHLGAALLQRGAGAGQEISLA